MHLRWTVALLSLVCLSFSSCSHSTIGKGLAGGEGDGSDFNLVPPVPSVPVITGTFVIIVTNILVSPDTPPDQYQAVNDTATVFISPGTSSNFISIAGVYLDPRIQDTVFLQDRGNNKWRGNGGFGPTAYTVELQTNAFGFPTKYIVYTATTSASTGLAVASQRTFSFGLPLPGAVPGLYRGWVGSDSKPGRPPESFDWENLVLAGIGVAQWEQDHFEMHYYRTPGALIGQTTTFNPADSPQDIEFADQIAVTPPGQPVSGSRTETDHRGGVTVQSYAYAPSPPFGIFPVDDSGTWSGLTQGTNGIYQNVPYQLRDGQSTVSFVVNNAPTPTMVITANGVTSSLRIIRLESIQDGHPDLCTAVRSLDEFTYEIATLKRDTVPGSPTLTGANPVLTVQMLVNTETGPQSLGSYNIPVLAHGP